MDDLNVLDKELSSKQKARIVIEKIYNVIKELKESSFR
jgi:DNA mismatch repair ATPase MutL